MTLCGFVLWSRPESDACHICSLSIGKNAATRPDVISRECGKCMCKEYWEV